MVFKPTKYVVVPNTDLLSWTFGGPGYNPDKDVYIDGNDASRRLNSAQVQSTVRKLISGFQNHGLNPGESVLVHSFSDIIYPILYLGIVGAGASFVGSNPSNTSVELSHILSLPSVKYIISSAQQLPTILLSNDALPSPIPHSKIFIFNTPQNPSIPSGFQSWQALLQHGEKAWEQFNNEKTSKETIASLFLTSGTTGLPKVAAVSHHATIARCIASHDPNPKPYPISRLLCLPMFHGVAATASHIDPVRYGIPTYILPRFSLSPFLELIKKYQITETSMVPAIMSMILQGEAGPEEETKDKLKYLKFVRCAGAPLDVGVQKSFQQCLDANSRIVRAWGLTEFGTATSFLGGEVDETGSCGRLLANVEAKLVGLSGKEITDDGVQGEVLLRGPSMMIHYIENVEATANSFSDGWLRTGDVAYCRGGKWYLVGRSKDMIKVRGWQVAPAELEGILMQHPMVIDVAVIAIKSSKIESELPRAYVVCKQGTAAETVAKPTEEELKTFLGSRLAKYKALDGGVKFVESLPKTASGKTIKRLLQEEARRELKDGLIQL